MEKGALATLNKRFLKVPVWVWFVGFVLLVVAYMLYHKQRTPAKGADSGTASSSELAPRSSSNVLFNTGPDTSGIPTEIAYNGQLFSPGPGGTGGPGSDLAQSFQKDFNLQFGQPGQTATQISQNGTNVTAYYVPTDLANEFGTAFTGGLQPADVYKFITELYQKEGLAAPPVRGTFNYLQKVGSNYYPHSTPFYAPGAGPQPSPSGNFKPA